MSEHSSAANTAEASELERSQAQAQEYLAGWQRATADYANLKRETEGKLADLTQYANRELLNELLPLVDYFKHALRAVPPEQKGLPWVEGIQHIQSKLEQVLAYHGVKELEVVGEKFDPALHEAVAEVESSEPSGTVVEEARTGFMLHDKLLQPARVKIAK
jgi:molecular chaperone GrpE